LENIEGIGLVPNNAPGMKIRSYSVRDRDACLEILAGNTPGFFVPKDCETLTGFLSDLPGPYFVTEADGMIVACGGWALDTEGVADLTWGMVRRSLHRRGIGRHLLQYRLQSIRENTHAKVVRVRTAQLVQEFFARQGFITVEVAPNGFGPGLDRVTMDLQLESRIDVPFSPVG
jgi:N-acetylglutamate synthase-like GNAT family acetyltransferase